MKIYKQADYDAIPRDQHGVKHCPTGDYSKVRIFEGYSVFGNSCHFGDDCVFGNSCHFGDDCVFGNSCHFFYYCKFGDGCKFGSDCYVYPYHKFGDGCRFGDNCFVQITS